MKIVLIGIQGAGKSTQGNMLSKALGIPYLSSGHIFRQMAKSKSKLGRKLKEILNSGALVPDLITVEIVMEYVKRKEYTNGFILDGFPRTVAQAEVFDNGEIVVFLDVSDKEALWRISGRAAGDREDETLQAIRRRIQLFHEKTEPVLGFYQKQNKLIQVDGEQDINAVFVDIMKNLKKFQD